MSSAENPPTESKGYILKEAPITPLNEDSHLSRYTYLRVPAKATPDGEIIDVCADLGTNRTIVKRSFLQKLEHSIISRQGNIKNINKNKMKTLERAIFSFYLMNKNRNNNNIFIKMTYSG
jgi:hypothetical protein